MAKRRKVRRPRKRRTPEEKEAFLKAMASGMVDKKTWPELEFEKLLIELGIEYREQEILGGKIYDFYIPSFNLLVEIQGDYWHYNKETNKKAPNKTQCRNMKNDKKKVLIAEQNGYKLSTVWENDLKKNYGTQIGRFKRIFKWKKD